MRRRRARGNKNMVTVNCSTLGGRTAVVTTQTKSEIAHLYTLIYKAFFPYPGPWCVLKLVTIDGLVLTDPYAKVSKLLMSDGICLLSALVEPGPLPKCFLPQGGRRGALRTDTAVSCPEWYLKWLHKQQLDPSDLVLFMGPWQ